MGIGDDCVVDEMSLCDDCLGSAQVRHCYSLILTKEDAEKSGKLLTREEILKNRTPHTGECDSCGREE